jgi:hypothetical protein
VDAFGLSVTQKRRQELTVTRLMPPFRLLRLWKFPNASRGVIKKTYYNKSEAHETLAA